MLPSAATAIANGETCASSAGPLSPAGDVVEVQRAPVPATVLATETAVGRRRGIDLNPVDVTTDHGARLLRAFVWPGREERAARLEKAIAILREDPPELVRGDYVELLPAFSSWRTV